MKLYGQYIPSVNDSKREASVKLLNGLWQLDTIRMPNRTFCRFVYFIPDECRFIVVDKQLYKYLIMRVAPFEEMDKDKAIEIVSCKYPFSQILVGVYVKRRLISGTQVLEMIRKKPEWF